MQTVMDLGVEGLQNLGFKVYRKLEVGVYGFGEGSGSHEPYTSSKTPEL